MTNEYKWLVSQFPSTLSKLPPHRARLLWISRGEPKGHMPGIKVNVFVNADGVHIGGNERIEPDDPSTIYPKLAVSEPTVGQPVEELSYFPTYSGMSPKQRGTYLRWLCDVSRPIEIGYVFVYYYGLERHLVLGDFDGAFEEILFLRKHHDNHSFQLYSASALIHSCLMHKRSDKLSSLNDVPVFEFLENTRLLIFHHLNWDIPIDIMMRIANVLSGVNRRYLRSQPALYQETLQTAVRQTYGKDEYPFGNRISLNEVRRVPYPLFANITLPDNIRTPAVPQLLQHPPFVDQLATLFSDVHEKIKATLKVSRKKTKS